MPKIAGTEKVKYFSYIKKLFVYLCIKINLFINLLKITIMKQDFTSVAIDKVKSQFELGKTFVFGCEVYISRKNEAYQYETKNGKIATMSARYWGTITFPDGTQKDFKKARGGAISRDCGLWSRKERDARDAQGDLYELTCRLEIEY